MTDTFWSGYGNALGAITGVANTRAQRQAGSALAGGDYRGASNALLQNGDLQGGLRVRGVGQEQAAAEQAQAQAAEAEQIAFTKQAVKALSESQNPLADFDAMVPAFRQLGTDDAQIGQLRQGLETGGRQFLDQVDRIANSRARQLEIQNLGNGYGVAIDKQTGEVVNEYRAPAGIANANGVIYNNQTGEIVQDTRPPEYIQRDPTKDLIEISPGGGAQPPSDGRAPSSAPRGVRNNNPGNIEDGPFARSLPGYVGSDGRFAIFETPEAGAQAAPRLLQSYIARGFDTPAEIINRWAPPSDNNPTQAYAQYVAQRAGIGVNDTVTPDKIPLIAQAIREFENGERPSTGQNVGGGPRVVAQAQPRDPSGTLLSEAEVAAAGLAPGTVAQRSSTGQISIVQGPQAARNARPTEAQNKDSFNANRMSDAGSIIARLEGEGFDYGRSQVTGGQLREGGRSYEAAAREWADSLLRLTTGAAATRDEVESALISYFPRPGDSPAVRQQKAQRRAQVERDALARGQGGAAERQPSSGAQTQRRRQTNAPGLPFDISPGQLQTRQRLVQSGASPSAPVGTERNPRYMNPSDPNSSWTNARSGDYLVRPDGRLVRKP